MKWLAHTKRLQVEVFDGDPSLLTGEARTEFVRRMVLGAIKELTEALDEVGWKWWSSKQHFNREKFIEELVDVSHFVAALAVMADCTDEEWEAAYLRKSAINASRQAEGGY